MSVANAVKAQPVVPAPPGFATPTALLIGIHATGPLEDLNRLQNFAAKNGFPSQQMDSPEGWELVIAFPPGSDSSAVAKFVEHLTGEFSSLQFKSAYAPAPQ